MQRGGSGMLPQTCGTIGAASMGIGGSGVAMHPGASVAVAWATLAGVVERHAVATVLI